MDSSTLHPIPHWRAVIEEQFRSVGIAIRPVVGVAGALTVAVMLFMIAEAIRLGEGIPFFPELSLLVAFAAPLFPIAVWRGGYRFRYSYLASLPVGRRRHVLVKTGAGWGWLMFLVGTFLLLMLMLTIVTGGQIGVEKMHVLAEDLPQGASAEEAAALARRWATPAWQWTIPFTSATVIYLIGSAVVLASSRTQRWLAGVAVVWVFASIVDDEVMLFGGMAERLEMISMLIAAGQYGLETLITGISKTDVFTTTEGERVTVVRTSTAGTWIVATLLWAGLAIASLMAVVWFDRND